MNNLINVITFCHQNVNFHRLTNHHLNESYRSFLQNFHYCVMSYYYLVNSCDWKNYCCYHMNDVMSCPLNSFLM